MKVENNRNEILKGTAYAAAGGAAAAAATQGVEIPTAKNFTGFLTRRITAAVKRADAFESAVKTGETGKAGFFKTAFAKMDKFYANTVTLVQKHVENLVPNLKKVNWKTFSINTGIGAATGAGIYLAVKGVQSLFKKEDESFVD